MKETALISIEIGTGCDLSSLHSKCPISDVDRYGDLDVSNPIKDEDIIKIISIFYNIGFDGQIAFHYYNEPLLYGDRLFRLIEKIRDIKQDSKFFLNTNGNFIKKYLDKMHLFKTINISNYDRKDWSWLKEHLNKNCQLRILDYGLDARKQNFKNYKTLTPCYRSYKEFIIDYYGNVHLCCMDWKGNVNLGNIHTKDIMDIYYEFIRLRKLISSNPMNDNSPDICKRCIGKTLNKTV